MKKSALTPILFLLLFGLIYVKPLTVVAQEATEPEEEEFTDNEQIIHSIYFGGGSYYIDEEQIQELAEVVAQFPNIHRYSIIIHSHTDNRGGAEYNQWLSQMRSESVIFELINVAVPQENISIKDFGQFNPVFDNNTWMGRQRNRRVDVIFEPIVF